MAICLSRAWWLFERMNALSSTTEHSYSELVHSKSHVSVFMSSRTFVESQCKFDCHVTLASIRYRLHVLPVKWFQITYPFQTPPGHAKSEILLISGTSRLLALLYHIAYSTLWQINFSRYFPNKTIYIYRWLFYRQL